MICIILISASVREFFPRSKPPSATASRCTVIALPPPPPVTGVGGSRINPLPNPFSSLSLYPIIDDDALPSMHSTATILAAVHSLLPISLITSNFSNYNFKRRLLENDCEGSHEDGTFDPLARHRGRRGHRRWLTTSSFSAA